MSATPSVTAVIVTYNSESTISLALAAVEDAHAAGLLQCVVVDNDSSDATASVVEEEYPWVKLLASDTNLGFGRGCNLGIQQVRTPFLLLLNPDAALQTAELLTLLAFMKSRAQVGVVAPAIREPGGALQHAGGLPAPFSRFEHEREDVVVSVPRPIHPGEEPFRTNWVCGALVLLRTSVLRELGAFDPRFFLYFEETDLFRRIQRAGWEIWAHGGAVANHVTAVSTGGEKLLMYEGCIAEHYFESRYYYLIKHFGWLRATTSELADYVVSFAKCVAGRVAGRRSAAALARIRSGVCRLPSKPGRATR